LAKVKVAGGRGKLFRVDAGATRGTPGTEPGLKLLTPQKKNYIQCPQFKTGPMLASRILDQVQSQRKGVLKMGEDIIKGGEPPKKKSKKKAAKKKAAKKK